jgi:hypothetical protein
MLAAVYSRDICEADPYHPPKKVKVKVKVKQSRYRPGVAQKVTGI